MFFYSLECTVMFLSVTDGPCM